jgi:hypothetical protein
MKTLLFTAALVSMLSLSAAAQTVVSTNTVTTVSNVISSVPAGATKVVTDGYNFFKTLTLTNPISAGIFGLQNGSGNYGGGIEVNGVNTNSMVNAGFAIAGIQTETTDLNTGKKTRAFNFYDATINLSISTVETIPVLNLPVIVRLFSGPFTSLNGGVLIGEQSGLTGDLNFQVGSDKFIDFGGGVVNCAGAAARGLQPAMPMAHINFTWKF